MQSGKVRYFLVRQTEQQKKRLTENQIQGEVTFLRSITLPTRLKKARFHKFYRKDCLNNERMRLSSPLQMPGLRHETLGVSRLLYHESFGQSFACSGLYHEQVDSWGYPTQRKGMIAFRKFLIRCDLS